MVDVRWEVKLGAKVMATDGEYGYLQQLLLDPQQERVVAILVRPHRLVPSPVVVVPEDLIADASENEVRLKISRDQMEALPKSWPDSKLVVESQKIEADVKSLASRGKLGVDIKHSLDSQESDSFDNQHSILKREHLMLRVSTGYQVFCQDGYAGKVSLILLSPDGRVKGFVMHAGQFPPTSRDVIVPTSWVKEVDRENVHLSTQKSDLKMLPDYSQDYELATEVDSAMWTDDVLRNTDYKSIKLSVQDGIIRLRGHVITSENKLRAEEAARSVAGVLGLENYLVVDQDLVIEVAKALGMDELTRFEHISVGAQNGVITLDGQVRSTAARDAAESNAASVPQVRGVINYLQVPDVVVSQEEQKVLQPPVSGEVYAVDMLLGRVERVIINPHNRRVTAFIAHGFFPDPYTLTDPRLSNEDLQKERLVVIPIAAVRYATDSSVMLKLRGAEAAKNPDFDPAKFNSPQDAWQPPYPYLSNEVLFDRIEM